MSNEFEDVSNNNGLAIALDSAGLTAARKADLREAFQPHFNAAANIIRESSAVMVTDATQVSEIKAARSFRLKLKDVRIQADKLRVSLKEESLRTGRGIDKVAGVVRTIVDAEEARLEEMEKFAERAEAERQVKIREERSAELSKYGIDPLFYTLGNMPEKQWIVLLGGSKAQHAAKIMADAKAEADRIESERKRAEEDARIRAENERLRGEAEAKERELSAERTRVAAERAVAEEEARRERDRLQAVADAERQKAESERKRVEQEKAAAEARARLEREALEADAREERRKAAAALQKEQEARAKLEAENAAREESERKRVEAEAESKRKTAMAPDGAKLRSYAMALLAVPLDVSSPEAKTLSGKIKLELRILVDRINASAQKLEAP